MHLPGKNPPPLSHCGRAASSRVSGLSPWMMTCPKHVVPAMSCWGPTGYPYKPGLPQGFSITGAAPGSSSLLLLSIRGEAMGRAERSLRLASLGGFLSCLSPTDIVPGVSPTSPCRGTGVGLMHPGDVAGSRCLIVPGVPCGTVGTAPCPGVISIWRGCCQPPHGTGMSLAVLRVGEGRERRAVGCFSFPFLLPFLPCSTQLRHRTIA